MYRDQEYWGRPVPGFGDEAAGIALVGLAPAAHGANRTGRMFTGDRSGDWLYGALHRVGLADRSTSTARDDGLELRGAFVTAAARCAPPGNRPTPAELESCAPFLDREVDLLAEVRIVVALGKIAWDAVIRRARRVAADRVPRPAPKFAHGAEAVVPAGPGRTDVRLLGSYHPSQQNTLTGRLTRPMLDRVLRRAVRLAGEKAVRSRSRSSSASRRRSTPNGRRPPE